MRLPMNARRIATVAVVCSAVLAGGSIMAWGHDHDRHDKRHHQHWWGYLSDKIVALTNRLDVLGGSMNGLAASLTSTLTTSLTNTLTIKLNDGLAALTAQLDIQFKPLNASVTNLSARLDAMDVSLGGLSGRMLAAEQSMASLDRRIASLPSTLTPTIDEIVTRRVGQLGGLSVVDNHGVKIGDFVGFDPLFMVPLVGISANGHSFVLRVYSGHLDGNQVYFKDPSCAAAAYVETFVFDPSNPTSPLAVAGLHGGVAYVSDASPDSISLETLSVAYKLVNNACQLDRFSNPTVLPATSTLQLPAPALPYRVK